MHLYYWQIILLACSFHFATADVLYDGLYFKAVDVPYVYMFVLRTTTDLFFMSTKNKAQRVRIRVKRESVNTYSLRVPSKFLLQTTCHLTCQVTYAPRVLCILGAKALPFFL
jgi:hypothetical protein